MNVLARCAVVVAIMLAPTLVMAQAPPAATGQTMNVKGIIATMQSVNCTSSDSTSCSTVLVITAGPNRQVTSDGHPTATVNPVTVVIKPQTTITWTRFNRAVRPNQLKTGDAVDIDYQMTNGDNVATRVNVSLQ